jgi:hypothetical protein
MPPMLLVLLLTTDGGCAQAISADNAQQLYAALKDWHSPDGCTLEDVRTEKDVMRIEWKKAGVSAPLVEVRPAACGGGDVNGPEFSLTVGGAGEMCPAAVEKLKSLVASERFGGAVRLGGPSRSLWWLWYAIPAAVLLSAMAAWLVVRRRRQS